MKKIINDPRNVVSEMLEGMAKANPNLRYLGRDIEVIVRKNKKQGKVGLVSGGGSGHEPAHAGYVGYGMLDAAVSGNVFASPSPDRIIEGIKAADSGAGVLLIIKNYSGDIMNFTMAGEMAAMEGIQSDYVVVKDDVAVEDSLHSTGRRGIAGAVFVHKIAGAAAESGKGLAEVKAVARKTIENMRSMGMAMTPCVLPGVGKAGFELGEDEMELGMGIHGEPGIRREKMSSAAEIAEKLLGKIFSDTDIFEESEVAVMVNGLGGTPLMELYILNKEVERILCEKGMRIYKTFVGNYMTALEMAGASVTLLKLDDELKEYLDFASCAPAFPVDGVIGETEQTAVVTKEEKDYVQRKNENVFCVCTAEDENDTPFRITSDDYVNYIEITAEKINKSGDYITQLDAATGDGDHWANINMGFENLVAAAEEMRKMKIGDVFNKIAQVMMSKIGGSSGILYSSAYMRAAKKCMGRESITNRGLCEVLEAMLQGIMERGKAQPGMKTMIDALYPAVQAYKKGLADAVPARELLNNVKKAAADGAQATGEMEAVKGRASYQLNKGVGHLDAGAVTMSYQIECLCDYIIDKLL